jgi:hypothetical protein
MNGIVCILLAATLSQVTPPSMRSFNELQTETEMEAAVNHLPNHTRITYQKRTLSAFDLESYKSLLKLSYDHLLMEDALLLADAKVQNLEALITLHKDTAESLHRSIKYWSNDHERLFKKWTEENKARYAAEVKAESPYPWVVLGIGGGVTGAGGIGVSMDKTNAWAWGSVGLGVGLMIIGLVDGLL